MSWFEGTGFSSLKSALANAQKSIDRVLDIQDKNDELPDPPQVAQGKDKTGALSLRNDKAPVAFNTTKNTATTPVQSTKSSAPTKKTPSSQKQLLDEDNLWSSFLGESSEKKTDKLKTKTHSRTLKSRSSIEENRGDSSNTSSGSSPLPRRSGSSSQLKAKPQRKLSGKGKTEDSVTKSESLPSIRTTFVESSSSTTDDEKNSPEIVLKRPPFHHLDKSSAKHAPERLKEEQSVNVEQNKSENNPTSIGTTNVIPSVIATETNQLEGTKSNDNAIQDTAAAENEQNDGIVSDGQTSTKSDSDFVVINEMTQSEHSSSLYLFDTRESSDTHSPKHYSSSNGKRSPTDSDFSILSEGRFHDMTDNRVPIEVNTNTDEASVSCSQRTSPAYSADAESEDLDHVTTPSSSNDERARSGSDGDHIREETTSTPTPGEEEGGELSVSGHTESSLTDVGHDDSEVLDGNDKSKQIMEENALNVQQEEERKEEEETVEVLPPRVQVQPPDVEVLPPHVEVSPLYQEEAEGENEEQNPMQPDKLLKKLAEMAEILQAREKQIISLSKESNDLQETTNAWKSKYERLEQKKQDEVEDLSSLTEEFTQRIASMEKKLQVSNKERDKLKKDLATAKKEMEDKESSNNTAQLLEEKESQIGNLTLEGEKLAKQQLQNSTIIKKLRAKEKDSDSLIQTQKEQLEDANKKIEYLEGVIEAKEDVEKKNKENIRTLNAVVDKQTKELIAYKAEVDDSREKIRSTQAALDASYKDIAELHKNMAAKNSQVQSEQLNAEIQASEELKLTLEKVQQDGRREQERLMMQIADLQASLTRAELQSGRKENNLRQEIEDLQQGLRDSEGRNQDLSQNVSAATRPLLRQIENLQTTFNGQSESWEHLERNLTERLVQAQEQLAVSSEKERTATENAMMSSSKVSSLESQVALLRQEKSKLITSIEMEKSKAESLEEQKHRELAQFETQRHTYIKALEEAQRDKDLLEKKLQVEAMRLEAERKKLLLSQQALEEKERQSEQEKRISPLLQSSGASTPTKTERLPIFASTPSLSSQSDILERTMSFSGERLTYENFMSGSGSAVVENLQAQVKQRDGEIAQLQGEITQLERTRASLAEEIVKLANRNEMLEEQIKVLPELEHNLRDVERRYNAVLQMYGEKAEEVDELKLDIQEIKEMYRQQIEDLVQNAA